MDTEKPNVFFFRFEDLRIYNKALDYVAWVYSQTKFFPDNEKQCLTAKFINAAQSIAINIAEGSGRNKTQFVYYLKMAKSSIRECIVLTSITQKLQLLDEDVVEDSRNSLIEMTKMLGALIASLQRSARAAEEHEDEEMDPFDNKI